MKLEEVGDLALKGLSQAVAVYNVLNSRNKTRSRQKVPQPPRGDLGDFYFLASTEYRHARSIGRRSCGF
jgi:hypothetical protein